MSAEELAILICRSLRDSSSVEIDGLGTFYLDETGKIFFRHLNRPRVFIAYAVEDAPTADRLYAALTARGYDPWIDRRKLLPGQNWPRRIEEAIESADFFLACFSRHSVSKRGGFQAEVRYALDCASRVPLDEVFLIPARLDPCRVPARITREIQYVDLFPDWSTGLEKLLTTLENPRRKAS